MSFPGPRRPTRLGGWLRGMGESALDVLYPPLCWVCDCPLVGAAGPGEGMRAWFCQTCADQLPCIEAPYCAVCGEPFDGAMTEAFRCWNCEGRRIAFDFAVAACRAEGPVREMIHRFKYQREVALGGALGALLGRTLDDPRLQSQALDDWLLVPVPLHSAREHDRGFNQSWELCRSLAARTGIRPLQALRRTRFTDTQAGLNRRERLANLRGVFALRRTFRGSLPNQLKGRSILLVDDVLTTGATTHECARILKQLAGVEKVVVITVARG